MLLLFSILLSSIFADYKIGDFTIDDSISVFGGFDTNPLFMETTENVGTVFKLEPDIGFVYDINELTFRAGAGFEYDKYFRYSNQSKFSWNFENQIRVKPDESSFVELYNSYDKSSDPILVESESRLNWMKHNFNVKTEYKSKTNFWSLTGKFESVKTNYELDDFKNFDNIKRYFSLHNMFNFFPETAIYFGLKSGYSSYLSGFNVLPYGNSDSAHYEGYLGLNGRITTTITMDMKLGFIWLDYQFGSDFHEPVFFLKFTDLFSSIHSVGAGYERSVNDSIYSNFYVNQKLFMDFKSLWLDNFINCTTIEYVNRYYRQPGKRIDHRIALISEIAVPVLILNEIGQNISLVARFLAEWVNSDAYNLYGWYTGQDLSADYKRFYILLGLTTKY